MNVNGVLYFVANDGITGQELWKSNGTEAGTVLVKDIAPGLNSSSPSQLTNVNGTLYFRAADPSAGYELFKSDGTEAGTVLVKDILPGNADSMPSELTVIGNTLFFTAQDSSNGKSYGEAMAQRWHGIGERH